MGNQHLHPTIQKILDSVCEPRYVRQLEIEKKIDAFRPDWSEAEDLVMGITTALEARYGTAGLDEVREYATFLCKALNRLELHDTTGYAGSADYHNDDPDRE